MTTTTVSAGETSSGIVLDNTDVLTVLSGGSAVSTTINAGGFATISSGSFASVTTVHSNGIEQVLAGGIVSGSVVSSGGSEVLYGTATSTTLTIFGTQDVLSGGTASNTSALVDATQIITAGGTAVSTFTANGSDEVVSAGGVTSYTLLSGFTSETVSSGGLAVSTTVGSSGGFFSEPSTLYVESGGTTLGAVISLGYEEDSGVTSNTVVLSGGTELVSGPTEEFTASGFVPVGGGTAVSTVLDTSATMVLLSGGTAQGGIIFNGPDAVLQISGTVMPTTPISGFAATDTIDLLNVAYSSGGSASFAGGVLTVSQGGQTYDLTLAGNYTGATFTLFSDVTSGTEVFATNVPCFAAGNRIRTDRGDIPVEALTLGDRVVTPSGEALPIRWIGHRHVDCRRHPRPAAVLPVHIRAHAFAPNEPSRDLFLSPDHAIFAEGALIPVKHLINGDSLAQLPVDSVTYFHVELPGHAVLCAEGLPVESYLDTGDRNAYWSEGPVRLHPAFGSELQDIALVMEALACAPFRVVGPEVDRVRRTLAARLAGAGPSAARTRSTSGPVTRSGA